LGGQAFLLLMERPQSFVLPSGVYITPSSFWVRKCTECTSRVNPHKPKIIQQSKWIPFIQANNNKMLIGW
jgi:hypothetical protein